MNTAIYAFADDQPLMQGWTPPTVPAIVVYTARNHKYYIQFDGHGRVTSNRRMAHVSAYQEREANSAPGAE